MPGRNRPAQRQLAYCLGVLVLVLNVSETGFAQTPAEAAPCSRLAHRPITLGAQLAQHVFRMVCAEQRLVSDPEPGRQAQIEVRQQAIADIKANLSHLNRALLRGMLTAPETVPLQAFKDAFKAMRRLGDEIVSEMLSARTPETTATVRERAALEGKRALEQMKIAIDGLLLTIEPLTPPANVTPVAMAFPSPGTRWQTRVTHTSGVSKSYKWVALEPGTYREKPVYRMSSGRTVRMFDTKTGSWMGVVSRSGQTIMAATPQNGVYLSPLWVGKSWMMRYTFEDVRRGGKRFPNQVRRMAVTAYETVTVPAGTYQAFKLEGRSYATRLTVWYAPAIQLEIKRISERLKSHYQGAGASTTELMTYSDGKR